VPFAEPLDPDAILTSADKAGIAGRMRRRYGLPYERLVAYGDSMPDAPLFRRPTGTVAVNADHHLAGMAALSYRGGDLTGAYARGRSLLGRPLALPDAGRPAPACALDTPRRPGGSSPIEPSSRN